MNIVRRVGASPQARGSLSGDTCPDLVELENGDFVVVGTTTTDPAVDGWLRAHGGGIADHESAVIVPRDCVHAAVLDIAGRAFIGHGPSNTPTGGQP